MAVGFGALGLVVAAAGTAFAHVEVQPGQASAGEPATFAFRVPNEKDDAATVALAVHFPTDRVITVDVPPKAGWTVQVMMAGSTVDTVTWSGGRIDPGHADYFVVSTGPLPTDVAQLVFTADQTYSNGDVVSWNQPQAEGHGEPTNPAPVLELTGATPPAAAAAITTVAAPPATGPATGAASTAATSTGTADDDDDAPIGLIVAAAVAATVVAVGGLVMLRRRPGRRALHQ
jgi:periplasmic copper chaperone A